MLALGTDSSQSTRHKSLYRVRRSVTALVSLLTLLFVAVLYKCSSFAFNLLFLNFFVNTAGSQEATNGIELREKTSLQQTSGK